MILRYYETVGRDIADANRMWTTTKKDFVEHWKALE